LDYLIRSTGNGNKFWYCWKIFCYSENFW